MLSQCHDEFFIYFYNSIMSNDEVNDEIGLGDKTIDYDETIGLKVDEKKHFICVYYIGIPQDSLSFLAGNQLYDI